jgi:hypothetical protein
MNKAVLNSMTKSRGPLASVRNGRVRCCATPSRSRPRPTPVHSGDPCRVEPSGCPYAKQGAADSADRCEGFGTRSTPPKSERDRQIDRRR